MFSYNFNFTFLKGVGLKAKETSKTVGIDYRGKNIFHYNRNLVLIQYKVPIYNNIRLGK